MDVLKLSANKALQKYLYKSKQLHRFHRARYLKKYCVVIKQLPQQTKNLESHSHSKRYCAFHAAIIQRDRDAASIFLVGINPLSYKTAHRHTAIHYHSVYLLRRGFTTPTRRGGIEQQMRAEGGGCPCDPSDLSFIVVVFCFVSFLSSL